MDTIARGFPMRINARSVGVALAPLAAVLALLTFNRGLLMPPQTVEIKPVFYPPVAVVFVSSTSEMRAVPFDVDIVAEHRVALRSTETAAVAAITAKVGQPVIAGEGLCRMSRPGADDEILFTPIDGVVGTVNAVPGTLLKRGETCVTVVDPQSTIATGAMSQRQAEVIAPGDTAKLQLAEKRMKSEVRIIYPDTDGNPFNRRPFEVPFGGRASGAIGEKKLLTITTEQVLPMLVPSRAFTLIPGEGIGVRIVTGQGPTGRVKTIPVTLVAATKDGFYVDGLPEEARLIVNDTEFPVPPDGDTVRIGQVG